MKASKIFGVVLSLHVGVIAVLIVQPGCSTSQPPTKTYQQNSTLVPTPNKTLGELIPATGGGDSIDPAFNANLDGRAAPLRPQGEFSEFDNVDKPLEPLKPLEPVVDVAPTVDIAGPSFETYTVKKGDSLWAIARRYSISLNELYAANGLNKNSTLNIGQKIKIPTDGSTATVTTLQADAYQPTTTLNADTTSHKVRSGDTLSRIARKYGTTVGAIKAANGKTSDVIRLGETLVIPVAASNSGSDTSNSATVVAAPAITGGRTHTVKAGEYPGLIAKKYGMTSAELLALNGINDARSLQVGQKLVVSSSGSAANVDTKTKTVAAPVPEPVQAPSTVAAVSEGPVEINVVAAEPIVESSEVNVEAEVDADALFDNAIEIPVIRLDSE